MNQPATAEPADQRRGLTSPTFLAFLSTQFLGALNDNMFRWLVVPIAKYKVGDELHAVALGAGLACFVVPYLLLASYAGYLADRFSKRTVIVGCKIAEVVIMALGIGAILVGNVYLMFVVVALMGSQSALFGPSKLGIIPEIVRGDKLSAANGLVGLTTVIAVVTGTIGGNYLYHFTGPDGLTSLWMSATGLLGVAAAGWGVSMLITRVPSANPLRQFPSNPALDTCNNLRLLAEKRPILRVAFGIAFFWSVAAMAQLNVDTYATKLLSLTQEGVGPLLAILSAGVGVGSVLAGIWSGGKVELGIVPLGAVFIAISSMSLSSVDSYAWTATWLFLLGAGGGLFNVPLAAYLQHHGPKKSLGSILAASNFVTFSGMLAVSFLFPMLQTGLNLDAATVFLVAGIATIPVVLYVFILLPQATIRFIVWLASHTVYRVRVFGRENLPEEGGALIVANHVSWLDGIFLLISSSRPIRMLAFTDYVSGFGIGWLTRLFGVIPIKASDGPKGIVRSLQQAREAIINGELVCIFAEGSITRTGELQPFQRGLMRVVDGTGAPVVPTYLDELWGSIFSYAGGRFFWKMPRRWPYPVTILFGKPLTDPDNVNQVRQAVETLGVEAVDKRSNRNMIPPRQFLRKCRSALFSKKVADSAGTELTGGKLLTGSLIFKRLIEKHVVAPDEKMVGILLPPSVGGTLANTSVALSGRVGVNLNYTLSDKDVRYCIDQCQIKHVLTSKKFLEKRPIELNAEPIFLEDLKEKITAVDKFVSLLQAMLLPAAILERMLGLTKLKADDLLTVIFTSGSTGEPKGVMLTHSNVGSNISSADQMFHITQDDVLLGVLPFFHSFGFTLMLWLPLTTDAKSVYHFNPLDGRMIGKLCDKHKVTIIAATPTFLKSYLKRCTNEQMEHLDLAIVGAEKMPLSLAEAFQEKFGVTPTEGYGTTELSPLAIANVPAHRMQDTTRPGTKLGTVGRPVPNVVAKIVSPDTGEDLGTNEQGLLLIKGPNVMQGYLNQPEKTAELIKDGWYNTGDIAKIDEDGFVEITGRQSRFSKIGGEMVPHIRIEAELTRIIEDGQDTGDEEPEIKIAVSSVPDAKKGERLVVLYKPSPKPVGQLLKELGEADIPNLWIPSADSFLEVDQIPLLGTGKLDLKGLKERAMQAFSPDSSGD